MSLSTPRCIALQQPETRWPLRRKFLGARRRWYGKVDMPSLLTIARLRLSRCIRRQNLRSKFWSESCLAILVSI